MEQLPLWGGRSTITPRQAIPLLSKSRFVAGLQCVKRLYLECYEGGLRETLKPATQALFEAGARVGLVARGLFEGGTPIGDQATSHDEAGRGRRSAPERFPGRAVHEAALRPDNMRIRGEIPAP